MNTYTFVGALVIAGIYLLLRFLEMRFVLKENKPLVEDGNDPNNIGLFKSMSGSEVRFY